IIVSGSGNLKLLTAPAVAFPKDFEVYDPKVTENFKPGQGGMVGTKVFEYLAVPRNVGKYTIPAVTFSYYDTNSDSYKTLYTQSYELQVEKGKGSVSKQNSNDFTEMEQIATDIRYIKKGEAHTVSSDNAWGSVLQVLTYLVSFLIFVTFMLIYRKQALENANLALTKGKRANKMAGKRLKTAKKLLDKHDYDAFYDEVIRALWGYVSDKLTIPTAQLTKENVSLKLLERGATEATTNLFLGALDECEFAKYAPGDKNKVMDEMYGQTIQLISQLEEELKVAKKKTPMMTCLLIFFLAFAGTTGAFAQTQKPQADSAYAQNNYLKAAALYEAALKQGKSPEVYYNLGNCYYRLDHLSQSLLAYERAALLAPSDKDIQANLKFVRAQTPDKVTPEVSIFYEMWWNTARSSLDLATWTWFGVFSFIFFLGFAFLYFVTPSVRWKKIGFFVGVFCLVVCLVTNAFAYGQYQKLTRRNWAIITAPSVTVKSSPSDTGTDLLLIHEGSKVKITDDSMKGWREIQLEEGKVGWIKVNELEVI
ncbi:MAG: BatD family protein, partial [Bacteroidaceae bacterium]